jgi:ribbon-helix-helix CopG family protein
MIESPLKGETEMKKTIIYLEEETILQLKYMGLDQGLSMAELIRRAVAQYLRRQRHPRKGVRR